MKRALCVFLLFLMGGIIGAVLVWVDSHKTKKTLTRDITLESILAYSATSISPQNFSCEGNVKKTVGAVVASIFENNLLYERNRVSLGCFEKTCTLSVTYCAPWQEQECGSRFLKFKMDPNKSINASSFACIDMP